MSKSKDHAIEQANAEQESLADLDRAALEARILSQSTLIQTLTFDERLHASEARDARRELRGARAEIERLCAELRKMKADRDRLREWGDARVLEQMRGRSGGTDDEHKD